MKISIAILDPGEEYENYEFFWAMDEEELLRMVQKELVVTYKDIDMVKKIMEMDMTKTEMDVDDAILIKYLVDQGYVIKRK